MFGDGTVEVPPELERVVGRLGGNEGIAGIETGVVDLSEEIGVPGVSAGLGEDLNAAEADLIVLRGEGILVHADFADGGFGGKAAAGESVDVELGANVGIGAGNGLELLGELVGIVGEGVEVGALHDDGIAIFVGAGVELVGIDDDLLLLHFEREGERDVLRLAGLDGDVLQARGTESWRVRFDDVDAGGEVGEREVALAGGGGVDGGGRCGSGEGDGDGGVGNDGAGGIDDGAGDAAGGERARGGRLGWSLRAQWRCLERQGQGSGD